MSKCLTEKYFFEVIGNILSGIYVTIKLANLGAALSEHHFLMCCAAAAAVCFDAIGVGGQKRNRICQLTQL